MGTKPNYELQLLKMQYAGKYSIFDCKGWGVYSDVEAEFGDGKKTVKVEDNGDFHFEKRKDTGTWVNTGLFSQVWKKINASGPKSRSSSCQTRASTSRTA